MSSYVFQFFCGPEGIALANPGRARTRPALAGPPPRATAELIFEDPVRPPAARLRSASASAEQERPRRARRSASGHRRRRRRDRHDRDRRHHRHHRRRRTKKPYGQQRLLETGLAASQPEKPQPPPRPSPCVQQWPRKTHQDPTEEGAGKASSSPSTSRTESCTFSGT